MVVCIQRVEDFFSNNVTHFITNKPVPKPEELAVTENKENAPNSNNTTATNSTTASARSRGGASTSATAQPLRSPIKLRPGANFDVLVSKAVQWDMKIWDEKSSFRGILAYQLVRSF